MTKEDKLLGTLKPTNIYSVETDDPNEKPLKQQVGGDHYIKMAIQPLDFIVANNLNFCQGNVIKYVTRYPFKNGLEDLKKARHYIDVLITEELQ